MGEREAPLPVREGLGQGPGSLHPSRRMDLQTGRALGRGPNEDLGKRCGGGRRKDMERVRRYESETHWLRQEERDEDKTVTEPEQMEEDRKGMVETKCARTQVCNVH